jgi:hypothetical protein
MHVHPFDALVKPLKRSLLSLTDFTTLLCVSHPTRSGNATIFHRQRAVEKLCL